MAKYKCSYCQDTFALHHGTFTSYLSDSNYSDRSSGSKPKESIRVNFYTCPSCAEISIDVIGSGELLNGKRFMIRPEAIFNNYPEYIPSYIRQDYEEACKVLNISPKSSATMSRRALQGMIRDYFGITKTNLHQEIEAIKDRLSTLEYEGLIALKSIANIGAHPADNSDINLILEVASNEAAQLIKIIEHFLNKWYIVRHESESLFSSVIAVDAGKPPLKTK